MVLSTGTVGGPGREWCDFGAGGGESSMKLVNSVFSRLTSFQFDQYLFYHIADKRSKTERANRTKLEKRANRGSAVGAQEWTFCVACASVLSHSQSLPLLPLCDQIQHTTHHNMI
mgnify:CR=1 FL=1